MEDVVLRVVKNIGFSRFHHPHGKMRGWGKCVAHVSEEMSPVSSTTAKVVCGGVCV